MAKSQAIACDLHNGNNIALHYSDEHKSYILICTNKQKSKKGRKTEVLFTKEAMKTIAKMHFVIENNLELKKGE